MFPEHRELISQLKTTDRYFSNLFDKHNDLDQKIKNIEARIQPGTPEEIDAGFFEAIEKPLQDAQGLKTHYTPPDKPAAAAAKKEEKKQAPKKKKAESKNVVVEQAMEFGD